MYNIEDNEFIDRRTIKKRVRKLYDDFLKSRGFVHDKYIRSPYYYQTVSPHLQNLAILEAGASISMGRRLVFPLSIFKKTIDPTNFKRIESIGSNFDFLVFYGRTCIGEAGQRDGQRSVVCFDRDPPLTENEFTNFKIDLLTFFNEQAIPFFEKHKTIEEYYWGFISQKVDYCGFSEDLLTEIHFNLGCCHYLFDDYRAALEQFQLVYNLYLDFANPGDPYEPLIQILDTIIANLKTIV